MSDTRQASGKMKYVVLARYGSMRTIGTFSTTIKKLRFGDRCIIRSTRGTEWAEITSEPRRIDEMPSSKRAEGAVIRRALPKDYEMQHAIEEEIQPTEYSLCAGKLEELQLPMRLACVEHLFGGEKIIFYFLADGRVDFRQLVKDLATEYRTRIEMRQIGVRDEARLLAEYEHCGRELCCRTFMKDLQPVTMRMAKLQKTTLDPTKISGRCGRLMCCLRFEDETYSELKKALPKRGTPVRIEAGEGEIISSEVLAQRVTVEMPGRVRVTVDLGDILEIFPKGHVPAERKETKPAQPKRPEGQRRDGGARKQQSKPDADKQQQDKSEQPSEGEAKRPRRRRRSRNRNRSAEKGQADQAGQPKQQEGRQPQTQQGQQPRQEGGQPQRQEQGSQQQSGDGARKPRRRRPRRRRPDKAQQGERPRDDAQTSDKPQDTSQLPKPDAPKDNTPKPDKPNDGPKDDHSPHTNESREN